MKKIREHENTVAGFATSASATSTSSLGWMAEAERLDR